MIPGELVTTRPRGFVEGCSQIERWAEWLFEWAVLCYPPRGPILGAGGENAVFSNDYAAGRMVMLVSSFLGRRALSYRAPLELGVALGKQSDGHATPPRLY